jgi:hypothetical protein
MSEATWNRYLWDACPVSRNAMIVAPTNRPAFSRFIDNLPDTPFAVTIIELARQLQHDGSLRAGAAFRSFFSGIDFLNSSDDFVDRQRSRFLLAWLTLRQAVEHIISGNTTPLMEAPYPSAGATEQLLETSAGRLKRETPGFPAGADSATCLENDIQAIVGLLLLNRATASNNRFTADDIRLEALTILGLLATPADEPRRRLIDQAILVLWPALGLKPVTAAGRRTTVN